MPEKRCPPRETYGLLELDGNPRRTLLGAGGIPALQIPQGHTMTCTGALESLLLEPEGTPWTLYPELRFCGGHRPPGMAC